MESVNHKLDDLAKDLADRVGDCIFVRVRLIVKTVTAIYDNKLLSFGITSTQFALLTTIYRQPITRAEIARLHHLNLSLIHI